MNKAELINAIANATCITKKDTDQVLRSFMAIVQDTVAKGEEVSLIGFGVFGSREQGEREVRNPKTGKAMFIPSKSTPYFKPGKQLKEFVRGV